MNTPGYAPARACMPHLAIIIMLIFQIIQVLMDAEQYDWVRKIHKIQLLDALIDLLKPIDVESKAMQAANVPTLHLCLPSQRLLQTHCKPSPRKDMPSIAAVRAKILTELTEKAQITRPQDKHIVVPLV